MMTSAPVVAFSHGGRRVFAFGLVLLAAGAARAEEPPTTSAAPTAPAGAAPTASAGAGPAATAPAGAAVAPLAKARKALAAKRWRDAKRAAEQALAAHAPSLEAKAYLGLADKGLGDCKGALAPLDAAFVGNAGVPGVAGALAACLGDKAADKQKLAEARLAAAREAAGAGRDAEARALYQAALGAALLTQPVESPGEVTAESSASPPTAEPTSGDVPDTAAAERAHAEAAAEAAKEEAARQDEARRAAPPPVAVAVAPVVAAPVVVATAPPPAPRPPLGFQVGIRSAASARDATGVHHPDDAGLVFTWLTFAAPYSRASIVLDLESTRWRSARDDVMSGGATAFYGLGLDWSVPFMLGGTGLVVGAEAMGGVLQSAKAGSSAVDTGVALQLMPHAGAVVMLKNVGVFLDAGWRLQLAESSSLGQASEGGFVFQGGLRVEMKENEPAPDGLAVGYTARAYAPNGSNIYSAYGGLPATNSKGPLLGHELTLTTGARLPRRLEHGVALTFVASDRASGPSLQIFGVAYLATVHAFATRQLLNPYVGAQAGVVYIRHEETEAFSQGSQPGAVGTLRAGLDVDVTRRVRLRAGFAYDEVVYSNDRANGSLSGYAVEAGAIIRL